MAIGYLVSLGNRSLETGDAISATQSTFNIDSTLGPGQWTWSGIWSNDGNFYSDVTDTGSYFLGGDGNVYFTPDNFFTDSGRASVVSAPVYSDTTDGVVDGTAGDDLIDTEFTDAQGDAVDLDAPSSKNDSIDAGAGRDTVIAGDGDDTVRGGTGDDLIFGDSGDSGNFAGTIGTFTLNAANISGAGTGTDGPLGQFATYDSVATTDAGTVVQMRVTVVGVEDPNMEVDLADSIGLNADSAVAAGTGVTFRFEFFNQATGEPIRIDGALTFRDIDTSAESVSAASGDVTGLALSGDPATNLTATATADKLSAGSDGTSSGFADENHWAQFLFEGQSSLDFTMTSRAGFTAYGFGSFDFSNAPVITGSTPGTMDDLLDGGEGGDTIFGEAGDDRIVLSDGFGNDVITGGESGETAGDTLDLSAVTGATRVDLTAADPEGGSVSDATSTATFSEIENIILGGGIDTLVLADGSGNDAVTGFAAPTDNGDGTFSSGDQLDVSALHDLTGNPVNTADAVVTSDADGNAVLGFPGGESLTLIGVAPAAVSDPAALAAMGVPAPGTVDGTAGADIINTAYTGDPEGDLIDANDAADGSNDDTVLAGDGNDSIDSGLGNDVIFAGSGDDEIFLDGDLQNDTIFGGEDGEIAGEGDRINFSAISTPLTINFTAPEAGTITDGTSVTEFSEIERFQMGTGSDTVIGSDSVEEIIGNYGNDSILAGGGNDTIFSGFDNDYVEGGAGDDSLVASSGADTIDGGTGDDQIDLGPGDAETDVLVLQDGSGADVVSSFEAPSDNGDGTFDGRDQFDVTGLHDASGNPVSTEDVTVGEDASGNAVLTFSGGESVTLVGISQTQVKDVDQLVAMGIPPFLGNFIVEGTPGDDLIDAAYTGDADGDLVDNLDSRTNDNDDAILAGAGNDTVLAGLGDDSVRAGAGDDSVSGGDGDDTLLGGDGDDSLVGGIGGDSLVGGMGADTLAVAQGDTAEGGDGDDLFVLGDLAEAGSGAITITGGEGGETTGDTLRLTPDISRADINFTNTDDATGGLAGSFTTADGSVVTFNEIENIICFTPGARILTQFGERAIEQLHLGDMVVTRDHGLQPIRWIGQRSVPGIGDFAPISVASSVMQGSRDELLVSPQHRILFTGYRAELLFGESEVLVAAKHLVNDRDVRICPCDEVTYIHIMFDRHEVIYAEGIATESFHAGDTALSAVTAASREELFAIFPELRSAPGRHRETARHCLKRHEAQLLRGESSNDRMA